MKPIYRIIAIVIIVIALAFVALQKQGEAGLRKEFNEIVSTLIDQEQHDEAITRLDALKGKGSPALDAEIDKNIALCYFRKSQDASLSAAETVEFLTKAFTLDKELYEDYKADYPTIVIE